MSNLCQHLVEAQALAHAISEAGLGERVFALRDWQNQRLVKTHDYLYQQPQYHEAMNFFCEELYGAKDFSQRDRDIQKVLPIMESLLSEKTLLTFDLALELNTLSFQLDIAVAKQLPASASTPTSISTSDYATAYLNCDNQPARARQLDLIEILANNLAEIAARKSILMMLKFSRRPAKLAGLSELQKTLENGAQAFKQIGDISLFIQPIIDTERDIMTRLFAGENCLMTLSEQPDSKY